MAELFTKTKDGKFKKIGDVNNDQANRIRNDINKEDLEKYLQDYWSNGKSGKYKDIVSKHGEILMKDLLVKPSVFFDQLKNNHFTFQNFGPIKFSSFLSKSKLDSYLKPEYIDDCMKVTTPRPSIGKGEFLLVSCFDNLKFNSKSGDLLDSDGNRIEVKGSGASLGGDGEYKQMNKNVIFGIYRIFDTHPDVNSLTQETLEDLQTKLVNNPQTVEQVMALLQNLEETNTALTRKMVELFNSTQDLKGTIAAAHLYSYLKKQKANFLFALNNKQFSGFKRPETLEKAYNIIKNHFNIGSWTDGNKEISVTLK